MFSSALFKLFNSGVLYNVRNAVNRLHTMETKSTVGDLENSFNWHKSSNTYEGKFFVFLFRWLHKTTRFHVTGRPFSIFHRRYRNVVKTSITHSPVVSVLLSCFYHTLTSSVTYYYTVQKHGNTESVCNKLEEQLNLVSSVGRAPVCRAGGRGFEPRPDQHSGSLNNWEGSAAFVMTTANG